MTSFEIFRKYYKNRWDYQLVAQDWKEKGGKIIGYPDINCPEELIIAAGCRPFLMTGDPESGTAITQTHMDYSSSLPARYLYEAILNGRYDFADVMCTTGGDRWLANSYGFFAAEKALNPSFNFGDIYYIERTRGTFRQHRDYNLSQLLEFKKYLEEYTKNEITNKSLLEAIKITNKTRQLLKKVSELRKTDPPCISGCEALQIIMASMIIPKAEYNELLSKYLEKEVSNIPKKDGTKRRIFVSGSAVDNLQLYELIESLDAIVIGEDTAFGDRYAETLINEEIEPMEALCDRYTYKPLDPWMYGMKDRINYRVNAAVAAKAQGVIFLHLEHDDSVGWDYPDQHKALENNNIPLLLLQDQKYKISDIERLRNKIEGFIETIRK